MFDLLSKIIGVSFKTYVVIVNCLGYVSSGPFLVPASTVTAGIKTIPIAPLSGEETGSRARFVLFPTDFKQWPAFSESLSAQFGLKASAPRRTSVPKFKLESADGRNCIKVGCTIFSVQKSM